MKKIINFRPFNIFTIEFEEWDFGYHKHNFYELILVVEGHGKHIINEIHYKYEPGDIYLLTPNDTHRFEILEKSRFIYIKYTKEFLLECLSKEKASNSNNNNNNNSNNSNNLEHTLLQNPYKCKKIVNEKEDNDFIFLLAWRILKEFNSYSRNSEELLSYLYLSLMTILVKGYKEAPDDISLVKDDEIIDDILNYLSTHVLDGEKVTLCNLGKEFFMSKNYIGSFIKRKTGLSLRTILVQYKIKIAEKLLLQQQSNINEIAFKLGFTDTSHFSNFFKKHKKISPSKYRDMNLNL